MVFHYLKYIHVPNSGAKKSSLAVKVIYRCWMLSLETEVRFLTVKSLTSTNVQI